MELHNMKKVIKAKYLDEQLKVKRSSLLSILEIKNIWWWRYGEVYKIKVKIWNRIREYALKEFHGKRYPPESSKNHSIRVYHKLKKLGVDVGVTYRELEIWKTEKRYIIMTLENKDGSLVFGAENLSDDDWKTRSNPITQINNLNSFYNNAYRDLKEKVSQWNIDLFFDTYLYKYKDGNLSLKIRDFDRVDTKNLEGIDLKKYNIREMAYSFFASYKHFWDNIKLFENFLLFLKWKQKEKDPFLKDIDIDEIFNNAEGEYYKYNS